MGLNDIDLVALLFFFPDREYVHVYIRNALQSPLSWAIHPLLR